MRENPRPAAGPAQAEPATGDASQQTPDPSTREVPDQARPSAGQASTGGPWSTPSGGGSGGEPIVIRDRRKVGPDGVRPSQPDASGQAASAPAPGSAATEPAPAETGFGGAAADPAQRADAAAAAEAVADAAEAAEVAPVQVETPAALGAELEALRSALDERTKDLQRVSAEYANYRKRVDRDRALVVEQATGAVLAALLPVLDDLDRAREHGDLVGPFGTVAEQLITTVGKFGLTGFGAKGDPFDPTRHEAVAHRTSAEVSEPTCVDVMRRGYLLGERLLRPALVAVADPE